MGKKTANNREYTYSELGRFFHRLDELSIPTGAHHPLFKPELHPQMHFFGKFMTSIYSFEISIL